MAKYKDKFGVDVAKRAARVRSRPLAEIARELVANGLDAGASTIRLLFTPAQGRRRDRGGLQVFGVECVDDGRGCGDPEILRRVGSSTSDLDPETRGRFGQGLIDVLVICERAEIRTRKHRLVFDDDGCTISTLRNEVVGMTVTGMLRHGGEGDEQMGRYMKSIILPEHVTLTFNKITVGHRQPAREIPGLRLRTEAYDPVTERVRRFMRTTDVELYPQYGDQPRIHELGLPVDDAPWELPFDINVLQKTPLDTERNTLPAKFKSSVIAQLIGPMSDHYIAHMQAQGAAPPELAGDPTNAENLTSEARDQLVKTVAGAEMERIVRRNPLDKDDVSESQELENKGFVPINRRSLPAGVSALLEDAPTVARKHDEECKVQFHTNKDFPRETERQRRCMSAYSKIASAIVGKPVECTRVRAQTASAAWNTASATLKLNIDEKHLWDDPLGEESVGVILHECAHDEVSGHTIGFADEVARLGGKLAGLIGRDPQWWSDLSSNLYGDVNQPLETVSAGNKAHRHGRSVETATGS